ncbi:ATP-binding cassette domain-containing protein [Lysobacter sp. F6437]|uniref:ATP-binding cassette domain-containing protein n=1 Tax=Lysobacter sp. F6437 TaxID=3459296 RepID=UPI00403E1618
MSVHLRARGVCLSVPHYVQRPDTAGSWIGTLIGASTNRPQRVFRKILKDISFSAEEGDRVALIGRNGAGKSTLLRVLTGAYPPSAGVLDVSGHRQALLNISLGFRPDATVAENILLRGTAMGIESARIRELSREILEFAGLADVAQHRLRTLSAGQRMRLGFAVSTATERDIMLLDEWLGAGDMQFIRKARARMNDRVNGSRIVILATHNLEIARRVCNKGVVLEQGRVAFYGGVIESILEYRKLCR